MRNIIRTKAVELSAIPAIAYKQKLAMGCAIKILRLDKDASAVCSIDKRTGEPKAYGAKDAKLFPDEAWEEAMEQLTGAPYTARGNINVDVSKYEPAKAECLPEEKVDMVDSDEYAAIVDRYSDENGRMNYALMNKDFMQFAAKSKKVSEMLGNKESVDDIMVFIVKSRATVIAGKRKSLEDNEVAALIETLDEINPRSAFKETRAWIKKQMARR
jgi:hypothetical protein